MDAVLQMDGLCCEREGVAVLWDITLSVHARRVGLVGRNGSGKSSLARLIMGLDAPASGRVRVLGGDVAADRTFALRTVGMIFQNPDQQIIFPTVAEEMAFGLENLGCSPAEIQGRTSAMLARFGWEGWQDKPVYTLSHGQKHLLCLMAVLVMEPGLIVFDEPCAGLDIPTAAHMRILIAELEQCVVMISHMAADLHDCDELIWLEAGRMAEHGPTKEVLPRYLDSMANVDSVSSITEEPPC